MEIHKLVQPMGPAGSAVLPDLWRTVLSAGLARSMTLTIGQAAHHLDVSESTLRNWVLRGQLEPIRRGAKPLRFHESDVLACAEQRMTDAQHRRLDALWARVLAV